MPKSLNPEDNPECQKRKSEEEKNLGERIPSRHHQNPGNHGRQPEQPIEYVLLHIAALNPGKTGKNPIDKTSQPGNEFPPDGIVILPVDPHSRKIPHGLALVLGVQHRTDNAHKRIGKRVRRVLNRRIRFLPTTGPGRSSDNPPPLRSMARTISRNPMTARKRSPGH